jgi:hypothetical protein
MLCNKGIFLSLGEVATIGSVSEVVAAYLELGDTNASTSFQNGGVKISSVAFMEESGEAAHHALIFGKAYVLSIKLDCADSVTSALVVAIMNEEGMRVASINSIEEGCDFWILSSLKEIKCFIRQLRLMPGRYSLLIELRDKMNLFLRAEQALRFTVEPQCLPNAPWAYDGRHGVFRIADSVHAE